MYTLFILFFASLLGIMLMIGRKLAPVRNGEIPEREHAHPFVPEVQKIKHFTYRNFRKYEHIALVTIVTLFVRFSNLVKSKYQELKVKMLNRKSSADGTTEPKPENKFLGMISDYKHRIRNIKHRIKEEEEQK